ncbi:GNAT family N-acetyltransferase [Paenibacillus sp. FSL H7-0942]|uniref:GNAT family N-acetyltransferase n=1 Tax=Paenibacillus amylolyticus TaxID=1451 RepID=A0ABD8B372_PAEAM|nr:MULTISPECIES: GNAT family N-acetyltransferase [Paenibacillus]APO48393.1 GNAT family N-acetyltransferase [Paenibacillus xylanexedens]KLU55659.1 GCN5 family acetyltransferase [Paenibacillus sp. VT-400]MBY0119946.1 GNAT family N-acetyltransferase [Paenibacillus xylanexedens]MDT9719771.1 GNAT family N-acetyltransferase [Paenibacillus sp. ClWae2A]OME98620.1 GNAT family N-acetyltransferase [Paenibacillus amylolyticus]
MAAEISYVSTEEQLEQALGIRHHVFVIEQQVPAEIEIDQYDVISPDVHHVLLSTDGQAVATGRLIYYSKDTAKMQRIAVLESHRSFGYGRVLLLAMEELARELGLSYSVLDAQCQAQKFYEKLGYEVISEEPFYDADILHVRMRKSL